MSHEFTEHIFTALCMHKILPLKTAEVTKFNDAIGKIFEQIEKTKMQIRNKNIDDNDILIPTKALPGDSHVKAIMSCIYCMQCGECTLKYIEGTECFKDKDWYFSNKEIFENNFIEYSTKRYFGGKNRDKLF
ncbi:MAG: hypothetical protein RsTaC01_0354 [Candidatus Paraimprobicoccus trichonymphae]|uniref:Uncharacterized protein n=1 Tax=Candidatus Paraimprobicoccus trichonymphae TaxID=3033793 RepID=A0AA48I5P8_9FIRM|nr:MAG: hypothetical protein RsTaC01_0354 [Candidatus Paraimprobicoccus trichonymphae]